MMTKGYFIELAEYNSWANNLVHSWLERISDEQWERPVVSSFNSIAETCLHVAGAESVWLDRLEKIDNPVWLPSEFKGSKKDLLQRWDKASRGYIGFLRDFDERNLEASFRFKRLNGNTYELLYYQVFAHALNHSGYHRGQIVTMLRQVGFTDMSSTDLSTFYWNKKN